MTSLAAKNSPAPLSWRQLSLRVAVLALLWWFLAGADPASWALGLPAVAAAVWLSRELSPPTGLRPLALAALLPRFALLSLVAAIDVAFRAMHPALPLAPSLERYSLRLPPGAARVSFMNLVSLMPGTLSVDLEGDLLRVHVLDRSSDWLPALRRLEDRVARVFGCEGDD